MGTSNLDPLIISLPNIQYHQCTSSSSDTKTNTDHVNEQYQNTNSITKALNIQVPSSSGEFEDGLKTPRSIDNRIPAMATCPPAPRKAKSVPVNRKRKASFFQVQVPADFIVYMDAMFGLNEVVYVPDIVVGDLTKAVHDHAKKLKLLPAPAPAAADDR
ncbi:hypothetical protein QVD17_22692 [Tagetes erecta]|uniref:Uncharacterized protein n=1 Tax=Tagetes erecta TaxID=13708 RepID=A0AAD8NTP8_TARER|nr:hypothetical protein QVD17_22692 [Tagetes erecta]